MALPYQDKRDDEGHTEVTLSYARKLVELEDGNEDIVIPAIILHDIGWSQLSRENRFLIFDDTAKPEEKLSVRLRHQNKSVEIAREILTEVGYPAELIEEILEIISEHDTREGFISRNEGLVRDADKLWRFSKAGLEANAARSKSGRELSYKRLEDNI